MVSLLPHSGSVRLANSSAPNQGTVEFYWQGRWNTLLAYAWSPQAAQVVCAQLGLPSAAPQISYGNKYPVDNDIAASPTYWSCSGSESSLQACSPYTIDPGWFNTYGSGDNLVRYAAGEAPLWVRRVPPPQLLHEVSPKLQFLHEVSSKLHVITSLLPESLFLTKKGETRLPKSAHGPP